MTYLTDEQAQQIEESLDELYAELAADSHKDGPRCLMLTQAEKALATIRAARAQEPITTPDVCGEVCARAKLCYGCNKNLEEANAKYAEQAEQEQVAVLDITYGREPECYATPNADDLPEGTYRLYAAPVRTKDLTDDELDALWHGNTEGGWRGLFRAVITKDREKNK